MENPAIRRFPIDNASWTPVVIPYPNGGTPRGYCTFMLEEEDGKNFLISSDPSNPNAWAKVKTAFGFQNQYMRGLYRYSPGDIPLSLKAVDGTGGAVIGYFGH